MGFYHYFKKHIFYGWQEPDLFLLRGLIGNNQELILASKGLYKDFNKNKINDVLKNVFL